MLTVRIDRGVESGGDGMAGNEGCNGGKQKKRYKEKERKKIPYWVMTVASSALWDFALAAMFAQTRSDPVAWGGAIIIQVWGIPFVSSSRQGRERLDVSPSWGPASRKHQREGHISQAIHGP
jgi:hypothetical protein